MTFEPDINNNPFGRAHPVLIIGIFIYIGSYFVKWVPGWLGICVIVLGSIASIYNIANGVD